MKPEDLIIGKDYLYIDHKFLMGGKQGRTYTFLGYHSGFLFQDKYDTAGTVSAFSPLDIEELKDVAKSFSLVRFFINFLKALGVFTIWGLGTHLVFKFLKAYAIWLEPYLDLILLGLLVVCICALTASWACHMEDNK